MKPRYHPCDYQKALKDLVAYVRAHVAAIDAEMKRSSTEARGHAIARLTNDLEIHVDLVRFGVLNIDFRTGKPRPTPNRAMRQHERTP